MRFSERYTLDGTFPAIILRNGNINMTFDVYCFDSSIVNNVRQKNLRQFPFYAALYTPHRLRIGDLVDASINYGEHKYPGTIVNVYPGCYHYDVLFEGDVVPSKYIFIKNIHLSHCKYQNTGSSAPWQFHINENVEISDDKWKTTTRAYVLKQKSARNTKSSKDHKKRFIPCKLLDQKKSGIMCPGIAYEKGFVNIGRV